MKVVEKSYSQIIEDTKLIKLATVTMLPYSFLFLFYVFYQAYFVLKMLGDSHMNLESIKEYIALLSDIMGPSMYFYIIILILIGLFFYYIVPPIAEWAIIIYLNKQKPISQSITMWITKFFPMFGLHGLLSLFSYVFFIVVVARVRAIWMLDNIYITTLMSIWFALTVIISFLTVYAKYFIILEWKSVRDAISSSVTIAILNFPITLKYTLLSYFLYLRFVVNILFLIWIPALFLYIVLKTDFFDYNISKYVIFVILAILVLITAYIEGIITAFFLTQWNNIFTHIKDNEVQETENKESSENSLESKD